MMSSRVGKKLNVSVIGHEVYHKDVQRMSRSCPLDWFTLKMKELQSLEMLGTIYHQHSIILQQ
jgi:hypothetical protein